MNEDTLSAEAVVMTFALLEQLGYPTPKAFNQGSVADQIAARAASADAWLLVLGDRTDEELKDAVLAYTRTPGAQWWPTPAVLLEYMTATPSDIAVDPGLVFDAIVSRIRGGIYTVADLLKTKQLADALDRIGGTWRLRTLTEDSLPLVRKRYIEAARRAPQAGYAPAATPTPALEAQAAKQLPPPPPIEFDLDAWRARRADRLAAAQAVKEGK